MKLTHKYNLERPAHKAGGDRYQEEVPSSDAPMMEVAYVNQSMSRSGGIPAGNLWITISTEPPTD